MPQKSTLCPGHWRVDFEMAAYGASKANSLAKWYSAGMPLLEKAPFAGQDGWFVMAELVAVSESLRGGVACARLACEIGYSR